MGTKHAAYSVLLKAVKEVMEENEALKLQSTIAAGGFEVGRKMYQWLQDSADNITSAVGTVQFALSAPLCSFMSDECPSIAKSLSKTLSTSSSSFIYCHAFRISFTDSSKYAITLTRKLPPTHKLLPRIWVVEWSVEISLNVTFASHSA